MPERITYAQLNSELLAKQIITRCACGNDLATEATVIGMRVAIIAQPCTACEALTKKRLLSDVTNIIETHQLGGEK